MILRIAAIAAAFGLAAFALWHPARPPLVQSSAATASPQASFAGGPVARTHRDGVRPNGQEELVVYLAGAVKKPGLYHLRFGDRNAQAVALAGGLTTSADAGAVNLAARANDGDEIYVPLQGEALRGRSVGRHGGHGRRHATAPPTGTVDVNQSDAAELAAVPGIGRALAPRIVELRQRAGSFASLDELLDIAGMTQTRLERARPYLRL